MPLPALLLPLLGGALGAGIDLALQLWPSAQPSSRVSWGSVALGGFLGALPGAALAVTTSRVVAPAAARLAVTQRASAQAITRAEQAVEDGLAPLVREAIRTPGSAAERVILTRSPGATDALAAARRAEALEIRAASRVVTAESARTIATGAAAYPILDHDPLPAPAPQQGPSGPRRGLVEALGGE
mgnify:CR=1 FL=1